MIVTSLFNLLFFYSNAVLMCIHCKKEYQHRRRHKGGEGGGDRPPMQFWPLFLIAQIR